MCLFLNLYCWNEDADGAGMNRNLQFVLPHAVSIVSMVLSELHDLPTGGLIGVMKGKDGPLSWCIDVVYSSLLCTWFYRKSPPNTVIVCMLEILSNCKSSHLQLTHTCLWCSMSHSYSLNWAPVRGHDDEFASRFGAPFVLHMDQGRNFEPALINEIRELCSLLGVMKTKTIP